MSLQEHHLKLITILEAKRGMAVSSHVLAKYIAVSIRTVKTYIKEINGLVSHSIITSTKQGYSLQPYYLDYVSVGKVSIPQTYHQRSMYIVKELMIGQHTEIDIYELCDKLYISDVTLRKDVHKMNDTYRLFDITFEITKDKLCCHGNEKHKRRLISHIIYLETKGSMLDLQVLGDTFGSEQVQKLWHYVSRHMELFAYRMNDFALMNILMHLLIFIHRAESYGVYEGGTTHSISYENEKEQKCIVELIHFIETQWNIQLDDEVVMDMYLLVKSNAGSHSELDRIKLQEVVSPDLIDLVNDVVLQIKQVYRINLQHSSFMTLFVLHLKNLLLRVEHKITLQNPLGQVMKQQCLLIYDIAILAASVLMKQLSIFISEDEVTYLALHIGAEMERQQLNTIKMKCAIICPQYHDLQEKIAQMIIQEFQSDVQLVLITGNPQDLKSHKIDIILSTVALLDLKQSYLLIHPFEIRKQKVMILDFITKMRRRKQQEHFKTYYHQFFHDRFYQVYTGTEAKTEILKLLCQQFVDVGYVDALFEAEVLQRECLSSTDFGMIAVAHSVNMHAVASIVNILVVPEGILWGEHNVYIVFLVALNPIDYSVFYQLYECIIELFASEQFVLRCLKCQNFKAFTSLVMEQI